MNFVKKAFYLLATIFLLYAGETKAQTYTYTPFPHSNFKWEGSVTCNYGMGSFNEMSWSFHLNGDTTINGYIYHILRKNSIGIFGYLREDSTRKVYIRDASIEMLLFDFGIKVGDTTTCAGGTFIASGIDTINYNGILRRRLTMHYPPNLSYSEIWVEGIGCLSGGPIGYKWHWLCNVAANSYLCLAQQDSLVLFSNGCWVPTEIERVLPEHVSIFPNPAFNVVNVKLTSSPNHLTYFQLYNAIGGLVREVEINSTVTPVFRNNLPAGIYFWQLQSESQILDRGKLLFE